MARRRRKTPQGLLLTPGAGTDKDHASLVAVEEGLAPLPVRRVDFPYRKEGRKAPDRAPKLIAAVNEEAAAFADELDARPDEVLLGGRSMGGRMCSMAVAEGLPARGLVLVAYPLHPPGKPENLRVEHFGAIDVPCLFVSGTKDPFGAPEELESHAAAVRGPVTHEWIEGKRHDLRGADDAVIDAIRAWLRTI